MKHQKKEKKKRNKFLSDGTSFAGGGSEMSLAGGAMGAAPPTKCHDHKKIINYNENG